MPGTPPTSPNLGIPRYDDNDTASFSAQVNGITDQVDKAAARICPLVTAIPTVDPVSGAGAVIDGQEIAFLADETNGVIWRLRYRAASASTYKWEFLGGSPLEAEMSGNADNVTTLAITTWAGAPSIVIPTLPNGGDFMVDYGAEASVGETNPAAVPIISVGLMLNGVQQGLLLNVGGYVQSGATETFRDSVARAHKMAGVTEGATFTLGASINHSTATGTVYAASLKITPIRVG